MGLQCSSDEAAYGFANRRRFAGLVVTASFSLGVVVAFFSPLGSLPDSRKQQGEPRALFGFDLPLGNDAKIGDVSLGKLKHEAEHIKPAEITDDLRVASHEMAHDKVMDNVASQTFTQASPVLPKATADMNLPPQTDEAASKLDNVDTLAAGRAKIANLPSQTNVVASELGVPNSPPQTGSISKLGDPNKLKAKRAKLDAVRAHLAEAKHAAEQVKPADLHNDVSAASHELEHEIVISDAAAKVPTQASPLLVMSLAPQSEKAAPKLQAFGTHEAERAKLATAHINFPPQSGAVASKLGGLSSPFQTGEAASQLGLVNSAPQAGQNASKSGDLASPKVERAKASVRYLSLGDLTHAAEHVKFAAIDDDLSIASHGVEQEKGIGDVASQIPTQTSSLRLSRTSDMKLPPHAEKVAGKLSVIDPDIHTLEAERSKVAAAHINVPPQAAPVASKLGSVASKLSDQTTLEAERAKITASQAHLADVSAQKQLALEPLHDRLHRHHRESRGHASLFFIVHAILLFIAAYLVRTFLLQPLPQDLPAERDPEVGRAAFAFGLFDEKESWGDDKWLCFFSCFCMGVRWAETLTNDKVRLAGSFWAMLTISLLATHELNHLTVGMGHILFVAIAVYYRQQLRERFGLKSGTAGTIIQDCCVWCCFPCCAAAQEARQVERVSLTSIRDSPTLPVEARTFDRNPDGHLQTGTSFSSNVGLLEAQE